LERVLRFFLVVQALGEFTKNFPLEERDDDEGQKAKQDNGLSTYLSAGLTVRHVLGLEV